MKLGKIDWDKAREILDEFADKRTPTLEMTARFDEAGILSASVEAFKNEQTRQIVHKLNRESRDEGRQEDVFFNFEKINEDGEKEQYYSKKKNSTCKEWVGLTYKEAKKLIHADDKFWTEIYDYGVQTWGRKYQRLLKFPMPERPPQEARR